MTVNPYFYATFHASFTHCQTTKYTYLYIYIYTYKYVHIYKYKCEYNTKKGQQLTGFY